MSNIGEQVFELFGQEQGRKAMANRDWEDVVQAQRRLDEAVDWVGRFAARSDESCLIIELRTSELTTIDLAARMPISV